MPGATLLGCGVLRDEAKWRQRDRRRGPERLDIVHPAVMTPVVAQALSRGIEVLDRLAAKVGARREFAVWHGLRIKARALESYRRYYQLALDVYAGDRLMGRLESGARCRTLDDVRSALRPSESCGKGRWVDVSGWPVPCEALEELLSQVRSGKVGSLAELNRLIAGLYSRYDEQEWVWLASHLLQGHGVDVGRASIEQLREAAQRHLAGRLELLGMAMMDAGREFDEPAMIGYGLGGPPGAAEAEFEAVRGTVESHAFVVELEAMVADTEARVERFGGLLSALE
jgi:hypothetical protein